MAEFENLKNVAKLVAAVIMRLEGNTDLRPHEEPPQPADQHLPQNPARRPG